MAESDSADGGVELVANGRELLDAKPEIPTLDSFVELLHWLRLNRVHQTRPCDYRMLFDVLERLGLESIECRFIARYGDFGDVPSPATWIACCEDEFDADQMAALYAEWECEELLRGREFPSTWSVANSGEWPAKPIRCAHDLASHLRHRATEFAMFAPDSQVWRENGERLLDNAVNAINLEWKVDGFPNDRMASTPHGFARQLANLADWIDQDNQSSLVEVGATNAPVAGNQAASGQRADETTASTVAKADGKKAKRSTIRGEAEDKIIAALTEHHQYASGGCLDFEPLGVGEIARSVGVVKSTVSRFFKHHFGGWGPYRFACHDGSKLIMSLKLLNREFKPRHLLGNAAASHFDPDE